jgi:2,4-dienoyl-CoA reductase-like NADH-dependent reductase (Old Yellow Enzyme family)
MTAKTVKERKLEYLLSPIKIGPVELKNRIALAPMNEVLSGHNGEATEQGISYYAARAKGGTALVSTGAVMGTRMSSKFVWGRNHHCFHEGHVQGLSLLTDRIHYFGAKAAIQMSIGFGRQGHSYDHDLKVPAPTGGLPYELALDRMLFGLSPLLQKNERSRQLLVGQMPREMTIDEIHHEEIEYANSCQLAVVAGFDVVEIHACHGYLEHQFLSPVSNKRTDMYGGEWRNRKRFLNEVCEQIRYACPGVALGVRISAEEHFEGGLTRAEMVDLAKDLEARGADYISLSDGGGYEENDHLITNKERVAHIPETARDFKKALRIPVFVAAQHDPVKADADIAAEKYDVSALGRQLFIDPEYANKLAEGRAHEIKRCTRCNTCLMRCQAGSTAACPHNPWLCREYASDEFRIGPRQKHESLIPPAWAAGMPAIGNRPWWKPTIPAEEKYWRPFRGAGPGYEKEGDTK